MQEPKFEIGQYDFDPIWIDDAAPRGLSSRSDSNANVAIDSLAPGVRQTAGVSASPSTSCHVSRAHTCLRTEEKNPPGEIGRRSQPPNSPTAAGGAGSDSLTGVSAVVLTSSDATNGYGGTATGVSGGFSGINSLTGTGQITGRDADSTWTLQASSTYSDGTGGALTISGFTTVSPQNPRQFASSVTLSLGGRQVKAKVTNGVWTYRGNGSAPATFTVRSPLGGVATWGTLQSKVIETHQSRPGAVRTNRRPRQTK